MSVSHFTLDERFSIITECRQSGLSDYRWCKEHNIAPGTFYSWVNQLKKAGYQVPIPADKDTYGPNTRQDIVKINLIPEPTYLSEVKTEQLPISSHMTLKISDSSLEIPNDTDPLLLSKVIQFMRCNL